MFVRFALAVLVVACMARTGSELATAIRLAAKTPELSFFFERASSIESRVRTEVMSACARLYDAAFAIKCSQLFYTDLIQSMAYSFGADQL